MDLEFLTTGISANGLVARYVTASSAAEAIRRMEQEGLGDVELVFDETIAVTRAMAARDAARAGASPPAADPDKAYRTRHLQLGAVPRFLVVVQRYQLWLWLVVMLPVFLMSRSWLQALPFIGGLLVAAVVLALVTMRWELILTHERIVLALRGNQGTRRSRFSRRGRRPSTGSRSVRRWAPSRS